jgi:hypothetical protein
MDVLMVA